MGEKGKNVTRTFSESFRREKVKMLEKGEVRLCDLRRMYGMSYTTLYNWKREYGNAQPGERVVVEKESDQYRSTKLLARLNELESKIGRQEMELDYFKEVIKHINGHYKIDAEKKFYKK